MPQKPKRAAEAALFTDNMHLRLKRVSFQFTFAEAAMAFGALR